MIWTALLLMTLPALGEVLDRIVVIIDNSFIITLSDIRKERAIQSALGSNPGSDDELADALIERHLVEEQLAQFRNIDVSEDDIAKRLAKIEKPAGVSDKELREAVIGELRRFDFMAERFGQFIRVSDEELLNYFNEVYAPELRRNGLPVPPAEQGMEAVRANVVAVKMKQEVDNWLADLRRRSTIEKISK
jgi:parvulin-like peptidyl-prolyl isomerase